MPDTKREQVLSVRDLDITFKTTAGPVHAIRGVNIDLYKGETVALVGESGSGKSVTMKAAMGILAQNAKVNSGSIRFSYHHADGSPETVDLLQKDKKWIRRHINGKRIAMVFQDPMTSLDPTMTIGKQIMEGMLWHFKMPKAEAYQKALKLLEEVGITDAEKRMKSYPHQLSGGMRQRVVIAIALSCDPDLLICDEPTTALDVTIQAKILELIRSIQKERGISVIYITHDLGVVAKVADYVDVMYAGKIVETGTIDEIFYDPRHPYTWGLLSAMPDLDTADERLYTIPGSPPNLLHEKAGDAFAPRNKYALEIDDEIDPPMFKISDTHFAATWLLDPRAPKVEMPPELKDRVARMSAEAKKIEEAEEMAAQSATPLLKVEGLKQYFKVNKNFTVKAVDDVSFEIYPGETYGLVGESGSGKSTIGRSIIRLYDPTAGKITFDGQDISGRLSHAQNNTLRTQMQMIFQDPMASLNPRKKVEDIIGEGLDIHHMYKTQDERREKVEKILEKVGLAPEHAERYPHQFSGGQRQRVGIARALIMNPKLIIADECISALDVSIQAQVVNLMKDIQQETGTAYLFIAHDLSMVKYISDRIGVLHLGHLLETGTTEEIFADPIHPYTRSLLSAIPLPNPVVEKRRVAETYDYATSGIDYSKGTSHLVSGSHYVKCTDEEFAKWCS